MKKIYVLVLFCSLIGCQKSSDKPGKEIQEVRFNMHSEPPTLDSRKAVDTVSIAILRMCFEGLMSLDLNGAPQLATAERVEVSEDQKKFVIHLKETCWSDGHPLTAFDFEKTWKTILDPSFGSGLANDLYLLKNGVKATQGLCSLDEVGVKALDDRTLEILLENPTPYFLTVLSTHAYFGLPSHITETYPDWYKEAGERYVGNGPFKLTAWRHQNEIIVERNPYYWDAGAVKLDRIHVAMIDDENTELSLFENQEIDWTGSPMSSLPLDAFKMLNKSGNLKKVPMAGTYYYVFNTHFPPFNNVNMRRAFALAINREEIVDNILQAGQRPATALVPPTIWADTDSYFKDADVEEARRCFNLALKETGLSLSTFPEITLTYNTLQAHHKVAQAVQQQWAKALGVTVKLENREWKVFLDELRNHKFHVARMGGIANFSDAITFLSLYQYEHSPNNYSQWRNPEYSKLLERAEQTSDAELRLSLLKQAERLMISEMPIIPIYYYTACYMKQPYLKGADVSHLGDINFKLLYVEKK